LARCLRLTPIITDDSSRLATVGWLNLIQTGFPPVRLIALGWAHNSNFHSHHNITFIQKITSA
ncbi:MAG: hypothetical protein IJC02_02500, partial [Lachnospiraceae bacterium]|nr:hypothetical protein [Lachnospiraceae bacterium]